MPATDRPAAPLIYALDLRDDPDLIERYREWHAPGATPRPILDSLRNSGIEDLNIFLCGNRLVMLLWPGPDFDPATKAANDAANSAVQEWEEQMDQFQQRLPFAALDEKWVRMEQIFTLQPSSQA